MKTEPEYFRDWDADVFGYGYGTGEIHIMTALKKLSGLFDARGCYNYEIIEDKLTPVVCWLLINVLCRAGVLEYGTSPRFGWLTPKGEKLFDFIRQHNISELANILVYGEEYILCSRDYCNCVEKCHNPFFHD